jgi:DMSO/TMAO reductase YedYZ molybdopterin-dependent catalytic subunit
MLLLAVEGTTRLAGLAGARRRFSGSLPVAAIGLADPGRIPVTQWLDDRVQVLDPDAWRLRVTAGGSTRDWTHADLAGFADRVEAVLDCTGGWYARAAWEGVRLDGRPLAAGQGFPARLVAPGRRGFWWVKWVVSIVVDRAPGGASRRSRSPEPGPGSQGMAATTPAACSRSTMVKSPPDP